MRALEVILISLGAVLFVWVLLVVALLLAGRQNEARALASFLRDCLVLLRGLVGDDRVSRGRKLVMLALVGYLLMPIDLVPDFIPVAGVLDDAIIAAIALRVALRSGGPDLLREHWRGPEESLAVVMRVAYGRSSGDRATPTPR